jgi:hypothetical protein
MKPLRAILLVVCILVLLLFGIPIRRMESSPWIEYSSIFSDGFIDYGRLCFFILFGLTIFFLLNTIKATADIFERITIQFYSLFAAAIDITIVVLMTIVSAFSLDLLSRPSIINVFYIVPVTNLVCWAAYYFVFFMKKPTIGENIFRLEKEIISDEKPLLQGLIIREIIYSFPLIMYLLLVCVLNYLDWKKNGFKDQYIEYTYFLIPIMIIANIVFPITALLSKNNYGVVEKITGITTRRKNTPTT